MRTITEWPSLTVLDLTDVYAGWYLRVATDDPIAKWRHFELKAVRSHDLPGNRAALVAKDHDGRFAGIEHHFPNSAAVVLEQPVTAKAKRLARYFKETG